MRPDDPILIEQRELALDLEDALDHEHDVGPAGIVLVEDQRGRMLKRPGQHALAEFGDLHPVAHDDGVPADEIDPADMRSEEHTSELQSLMRISYAVFCLKKKQLTNQPSLQ